MTWGLWGHTASTATKDNWESGETAHYEYHCLQSPESSDYHLWQRSHQPVQVLGPSANAEDFSEDFPTFGERADEGLPRVYRVRFNDGHEDDAWEDELLTHPSHFQPNHAPPHTASRTAGKNHGLEDIEFVLGGHSGLYHPDTEYPHHRHLSTNAIHTPTGQTVAYMDRYNTGELYEIHVDPEFRRRGIATGLFDWTKNNIDPDTSHSLDMTDDGKAWSQSMGWNPRKYNPKQLGSLYDDHHTTARTAMPRQDAYSPYWDAEDRQTEEPTYPEDQVWHHRSDHDLPDGTMLVPGGGKSKWEQAYKNGGDVLSNHQDWVWLSTPDMDYGSDQGKHLYQVQPEGEGPYPWNDDDTEYVAPRARIIRKINPKEANLMTAAITVYTQPSCIQCTMTKKQLDKLGIDHDTVDVSTDPDAHAYVTGLGYTSAPVVVVGDGEDHWAGFRPDRLKELTNE